MSGRRNTKRKTRKRNLRKKLQLCLLSGTLLVGIGSVVSLPLLLDRYGDLVPLKVQELEVTGSRVLSGLYVRKLAGIEKGDPLFGHWIGGVIEKIKANPRVDTVTVVRHVTGKVLIKIDERRPTAMVNRDQLFYVDASGQVLDRANAVSTDALDFPVITGPWSSKASPEEIQENVQEALQVLDALTAAGLAEKEVSELHLDRRDGWVVFRVGWTARFRMGRKLFKERAIRLVRVLRDFEGREALLEEVNLDFENRAIVKLRKLT